MATPLRSVSAFLSPKVSSPLSPLSPKLLSVARTNENFDLHRRKVDGVSHIVKKLKFSPSPLKFSAGVFQLKITDHSGDANVLVKKDILINTPNKLNIIKNGLVASHFNILGQGAFGKVIRGIHEDKVVAVKIVKNKLRLGERNALYLCHENIVKIIDIVQKETENFSLVIMEFFPNSKQLATVMEESAINLENRAISYAIDICKGLEFCHKNGILHLDLKPQNILVCEDVCKICDFGNSVKVSEVDNYQYQGTVIYSAPELLQGKRPTEKSDIYSLGVVIWQLKFKVPPYSGLDNAETAIYMVVKCNWRPDTEKPSDEYSEIYHNCWDMDPMKRPHVGDVLKRMYKLFY